MTLSVLHGYATTGPQSASAGIISSSYWNNSHSLSGVLDAANGGTGVSLLGTSIPLGLASNAVGGGAIVLATAPTLSSPTFITPVLGVASGTTLALTQGTITNPATLLSGTTTWNDGADTFTGLSFTVTKTAAASASRCLDFLLDINDGFGAKSKLTLSGAGYVGIFSATTQPLARLHVGDQNSNASVDSQILISRTVGNTGDVGVNDDMVGINGHAFSDSSTINRSGTMAYNSFDARCNFHVGSFSQNYDHYAAFQSATTNACGQTITNWYGLYDVLATSAGTVTNKYGVYLAAASGAGAITNEYGLYVEALTKGGTLKYSVFTAGTTPSAFGGTVTAPVLTLTQGTITDPATMLSGTATWNDASDTFTAWKLDVTDTNSSGSSLLLDLQVGSSSIFKVTKGGTIVATSLLVSGAGGVQCGTTYLFFTASTTFHNRSDGVLTLSNFAENDFGRLQFGGTTSSFPALKRSGATLACRLADDSADAAFGFAGGTVTGHLLFNADNTYDIGASGATRPRHIYLVGTVTGNDCSFTSGVSAGANAPIYFNNSTIMETNSVDGNVKFSNFARTAFGLMQFGGTTSSFPSLKRSSTALHARLADDSAYAPFSAELTTVAAGTATPANGSTAARLLLGTTASFGIYYGSGAPTVSAAKGSIYLRSDGTGVADRMYINTDAGTTWTAVATAG